LVRLARMGHSCRRRRTKRGSGHGLGALAPGHDMGRRRGRRCGNWERSDWSDK
jgi:hypothetical protein